jgi:cytochrome oxidase Cu insertion factor (SCO1/SenC/PrrC family)
MAMRGRILAGAVLALAALVTVAGCGSAGSNEADARASSAAMANPNLDPGTSLHGVPAPGFRLVNQFGQPMSLSQFRGKVVILAFVDSQCTTVCPLTTASMVEARRLLGPAGAGVRLLGVNANPAATSVVDVRGYSASHGMINQWDFLTGSRAQLEAVWRDYHIAAQINAGMVDHTPALLVIDARGREQVIYLTELAYASVDQSAQIIAQDVARLLPGHPRLRKLRSVAYIAGIGPASRATLPAAPGGVSGAPITLGPGHARLLVFFATWLQETSDLRGQLTALDAYARAAQRGGLAPLVAVDETTTEPSTAAVASFLRGLRPRLRYPVALDGTGRVADGYGVQDQPWFVLVSASGQIRWHHDGWLPVAALSKANQRLSQTPAHP